MLPGILSQLGTESLTSLKRLATAAPAAGEQKVSTAQVEDDDDEVPGWRDAQKELHTINVWQNCTLPCYA